MEATAEYLRHEALLETLEDYRLQEAECRARRNWLDSTLARGRRQLDGATSERRRLAGWAGLRLLAEERALCEQRMLVLRHAINDLNQRLPYRPGEYP